MKTFLLQWNGEPNDDYRDSELGRLALCLRFAKDHMGKELPLRLRLTLSSTHFDNSFEVLVRPCSRQDSWKYFHYGSWLMIYPWLERHISTIFNWAESPQPRTLWVRLSSDSNAIATEGEKAVERE